MGSLLIRNDTVVTVTDNCRADVYIEGESVSMIDARLEVNADREIDATGCYLFPGGIDAHAHMELPSMGKHASDTEGQRPASLMSRYQPEPGTPCGHRRRTVPIPVGARATGPC